MKSDSEHKIPIDLISRFFSGEASKNETDALNSWLAGSQDNVKVFEEFRKVWEKTGVLAGKPGFDLDEEWEEFQSRINLPNKESVFRNFLAGPKFFGSFYRMAAVVAIGLILGYSIFYFGRQFSTQTIYAEAGKEKVILPDGSTVTLNTGAEIIFPKTFSSENRIVSFKGEGFFTIQKDSLHPFIIRSNNLSIRVLGTSFNIKENTGSQEIEVIVNTGKVALYEGSDRNNEKVIISGERAVYNKIVNKIIVSENKDMNYLSWETGIMVFEGSSLSEVINVLSSVYHKKFAIKSENLKNCRVTVRFESMELPAVLKVLEATLDIHFTVKEEVIELSGKGC